MIPARTLFSLILALILPAASIAMQAAEPPQLTGIVRWVHDGDTLEVEGLGRVRLVGIDVPERAESPRDDFLLRQGVPRPALRQASREALRFCIDQVKGQTVHLILEEPSRDRHGRLLAYVYLPDGRLLNRVLLDKGLAVVYRRFDFDRKEAFLTAEREARNQHRGLWQKTSP